MIVLSKRLATVASLVSQCELAADVGTDHAYLAVWLLQNQIARHVFATDIHSGPLSRAKLTAEANGLTEQMTFHLCEGLQFTGAESAQTVIMAGMGGETMISILQAAPWTWNNTQLVLQPQSKQRELLDWLRTHQIGIDAARLCEDAGKLYLAFRASGCISQTKSVNALLFEAHDALFPIYLEHERNRLTRALTGMQRAERDTEAERAVLQEQIEELDCYRKAVEQW